MSPSKRQKRETNAQVLVPRLILLITVLALLCIGLVMVYSSSMAKALSEGDSSFSYIFDQLLFAVIGVICAIIVWKVIPLKAWRGILTWIVWAAAILLLILVAVMGTESLGAQRWLVIGPVSLQPSEFAKIAFVLMAAQILYNYRSGELSLRAALIEAFVFILLPIFFLYRTESDLGTTLIVLVSILAILWVGEVPLRYILIVIGVLIAFAIFAVVFTDYRSDRLVFLDPWNDGENGYGSGWQLIHSYYALADGGLFGVGIGNSSEKFLWLSEAETDFIFAIIGEEMGLVGALLVVALFVALLYAGLRIARLASNNFGAMIAASLAIMIVFQAFLNIGCVIGLLPTTGKPLPFISSGGSSLITTLIMVGFMLAVSDSAQSPDIYDRRREDLRVVRVASTRTSRANRASMTATQQRPTRISAAQKVGNARR